MRAEERPSIVRMKREARRLDLASSIPRHVLAPMLYDVVARQSDDAIVVIDAAERPSVLPPDLSTAMVAVVRRPLLDEALGHAVCALSQRRNGHVPFVVIDRHGTTVVFLELGPIVTAPGGSA
jgi:hypothetical protein